MATKRLGCVRCLGVFFGERSKLTSLTLVGTFPNWGMTLVGALPHGGMTEIAAMYLVEFLF